jgi:hypothetical protein
MTGKPKSFRLERGAVAGDHVMTLILELPDNKEAALKAKAMAQGLSAQQFAEQVLNRALEEDNRDTRSVWDIFAESRKRVPAEEFAKLPEDGADEHDHYLYGHPKRNQ